MSTHHHITSFFLLALFAAQPFAAEKNENIFARKNLVAWCIVPFDGKKRGPAERAEMVKQLGLSRVAYDWRNEHVPTFEQEILEYKKREIEYFAFWSVHEEAFKLFEKHGLTPQIWRTLGSPDGATQEARVAAAAKQMLPVVERTKKLGSKLGLYNHGGWGGEPENMVAVCKYLHEHHDAKHVGLVYNLHHGHGHIANFKALLATMKPYLLCLNLNGMATDGDKRGQKILPLGEGEHDVSLLKTIERSGYGGPIGIIGHTQDDVEKRLHDNLDGLDWILPQLSGKPAGAKPTLRTWSPEKAAPPLKQTGVLLEGRTEYRKPPITVECRATLPSKASYNILVASDTKQSAAHWEIFSMNGTGTFTAYIPGYSPDHVRSTAMIVDNKPHTLSMTLTEDRVQLFVDGKRVADQEVKFSGRPTVPGGFGIGRLVEGGLGCSGPVDWVRVSTGVRKIELIQDVEKDDATLILWRRPEPDAKKTSANAPYSPELVAELLEQARGGNPHRGLMAFSSAKSACLSCHKIGKHGGTVGPALTKLAAERKPHEIIESVMWPKRHVRKEFVAHQIITVDGRNRRGYIVRRDDKQIVLRDPTKLAKNETTIAIDEIEVRREVGSLMPDNLMATMSSVQQANLFSFLLKLGREDGLSPDEIESMLSHAMAHAHGPAKFEYDRKPLSPKDWPSWQHHVNRDRIYDFYAKQADFFRKQKMTPPLLMAYPGLDGGELGHWGNQNEKTWASGKWNETDLGMVHAGVFRGAGVTVARGVCVRLGDKGQMAVCFNPDTATYDAVWSGGFIKFSTVRHGFVSGSMMDGQALPRPAQERINKPIKYLGYYRAGDRVLFSYKIGERKYFDSPSIKDGQFSRYLAPADKDVLAEALTAAKPQWPQKLTTKIEHGTRSPYAVDTIHMPKQNPWGALMFGSGHDFLPDGSAMVCTMQGDVWHVTGLEYPSRQATWRRFASGLHHPQGVWIDDDGIFVQCRDQLTRLHDLNKDGEADFYECYSNAFATSPAGHDFICGLVRDKDGNFFTASGNQGLVRISKDGQRADVIATGFRNPDGIGILPDGTVTVPCSEGEWTPATMVCAVRRSSFAPRKNAEDKTHFRGAKGDHFGYRGPKNGKTPELPFAYFPRGLDNSAGGQTIVNSDRWGPLEGQLLHLSFGTGSHFLLLRDEVEGQLQGAVVPLPGEFRSGAHRGRFNPKDGQLYVTGMQGWGSYTPNVGCFDRVRYTGDPVQLPTGFHVHENGVKIQFASTLDRDFATKAQSHFAQCWNYRYSQAYGSPEFSTRHIGMRGHDTVAIKSAHLINDKTLFLELPDLQPVNQLHLRVQSSAGVFHDLFVTVHQLDKPFEDFPGYRPTRKTVQPHPILADLAMATRSIPNPHRAKIEGARNVVIETGTNLSFATRSFRVKAGEPIALTLANPDVVPHNWALAKPGTLQRVGHLTNKLISDPEAALRHYVPRSDDVLAYTDVVLPREKFTIYFHAPKQPGRYPFLCTFPGHWLVMNGEMIVE